MSNDPVWLADNVMAFLLDRQGDAPDKSLLQSKIEAYYDGKAFPFTFRFGHVAWSETTGQDYGVVVALDERPVLHVDLYSVDLESPLAKHAFHVVRTFEDGEWTGRACDEATRSGEGSKVGAGLSSRGTARRLTTLGEAMDPNPRVVAV